MEGSRRMWLNFLDRRPIDILAKKTKTLEAVVDKHGRPVFIRDINLYAESPALSKLTRN